MTRRRRGAEGQSSVELALVLPVVALVGLALVQVGVVAQRQILVVHAAREAARSAAVADDPAAAAVEGAHRAGGLEQARLDVRTVVVGEAVEVTVSYVDRTDVVLAGALLGDVTLSARATMRRE